MSDVVGLLRDSIRSLLDRHATPESLAPAERAGWAAALWTELERAGMTRVGLPEALGGAGGDLEDAAAVVRETAAYSAAVPIAETALVAGWLLANAGLPIPTGPLTAAVVDREGRAEGVPYARVASAIVVLALGEAGWGVALVEPADYTLEVGANLAGEPRDRIALRRIPALTKAAVADPEQFFSRGALARAIQIGGALGRVLELSLRYATEREQFGSPIHRFQAVQHLITTIAEETYAASATIDAAVAAPSEIRIATAKVRCGEAAGVAASAAHQVHGAIGFTDEHMLHHSTRRLWSWRDELGTEASWARRLGGLACARGADHLWDLVIEEA